MYLRKLNFVIPNVDPMFHFHVYEAYRLLAEFRAKEIRISNVSEIPNFLAQDRS